MVHFILCEFYPNTLKEDKVYCHENVCDKINIIDMIKREYRESKQGISEIIQPKHYNNKK